MWCGWWDVLGQGEWLGGGRWLRWPARGRCGGGKRESEMLRRGVV